MVDVIAITIVVPIREDMCTLKPVFFPLTSENLIYNLLGTELNSSINNKNDNIY